MPTVEEMASGYVQQCENKLQELLNQSDNLQKQIEALKTHVEECVDELSDPLDGVVKTCETSKESVS
jgi:peptidoglycan hydrolase CwlO-like protein